MILLVKIIFSKSLCDKEINQEFVGINQNIGILIKKWGKYHVDFG
jgi:hypothetical protein